MPTPPLVVFSVDRPGWTFDNIARQLSREMSLYFSFKILPFKRIVSEDCNILVNLWWATALRVISNTRREKVVTCVYDEYSWNIDEGARHQFKLTLKQSDGLVVCNRQMFVEMEKAFGQYFPDHVAVIPDGVDTNLFTPMPLPAEAVCGWTGNSTRHTPGGPTDHKGLELLRRAQKDTDVPLSILDAAAGGSWPLTKMPEFYRGIAFLACASVAEGTPNPVLEAMACGRPVLSTPVGIVPELVQDGVNGFIVERTEEALRAGLEKMHALPHKQLEEMGRAAQQAISKKWSWPARAEQWRAFLQSVQYGAAKTCRYGNDKLPRAAVQLVQPEKRTVPSRPHALLVSDVREWAFHQNLTDLAEYLEDQFDFTHWFIEDYLHTSQIPAMPRFDCVFTPYHRWPITNILPWDRTVGSLRALWFYPENPKAPGPAEYRLVNKYKAFHVVTEENYQQLKGHCPGVVYLTNPVNMRRFDGLPDVTDELIVSWNGNAQHRSGGPEQDVKGFYAFVRPACATAGVKLQYAEYNTCRLSPAEMPSFYKQANVALCASLYEGASNSVMEAMAAGQALIATRVGNNEEMQASQLQEYGDTGIVLVDRDIGQIAEAISTLKKDLPRVRAMGELNKLEVATRWSWDTWASAYAAFLWKGVAQ